jgi:multimeric flavodoxin WrbA
MRALVLDCTSAIAPDQDVEIATKTMIESLLRHAVEVETLRILDTDLADPAERHLTAEGASGVDDRWVEFREQVLEAEILLLASPATWLGQPSDEARRVLDGLAELLAERDGDGRSPAVNHVAGVVVAGDRMGGDMVLSEVTSALARLGFTIPGQATTYLNAEALASAPAALREQSAQPGREAAANLVAVAQALRERPIPPPEPDQGTQEQASAAEEAPQAPEPAPAPDVAAAVAAGPARRTRKRPRPAPTTPQGVAAAR